LKRFQKWAPLSLAISFLQSATSRALTSRTSCNGTMIRGSRCALARSIPLRRPSPSDEPCVRHVTHCEASRDIGSWSCVPLPERALESIRLQSTGTGRERERRCTTPSCWSAGWWRASTSMHDSTGTLGSALRSRSPNLWSAGPSPPLDGCGRTNEHVAPPRWPDRGGDLRGHGA
jgi:hypothetical protein